MLARAWQVIEEDFTIRVGAFRYGLIQVYPLLGYDIHILPKVSVAERANWILASLAS